ncbi:MAG: glycoside hydrolase family 88 protein [Vibrio sp.]
MLITSLLSLLVKSESIEDFPAYTNNGNWICCSHWSNGYAVGTLLLSYHIQNKPLPSIQNYLAHLTTHFKSPKFQDIGYLFQSSSALYDELKSTKELSPITKEAIDYLLNCINESGNLVVNWRSETCYGIDQFSNSLLLGWAALRSGSNDIFRTYSRLIKNSIELFVHNRGTYEYVFDNYVINHNSGHKNHTWLRGHAWAVMGICYAIFIFSTQSESTDDLYHCLERLLKPIESLLDQFGDLPCVFSNDGTSIVDLIDTSATCCIATSLQFLSNRRLLSSKTMSDTLLRLYPIIERNVSKGTLFNVSYPPKIINTPGESSSWGCYFYLRYCIERKHEESRIDII